MSKKARNPLEALKMGSASTISPNIRRPVNPVEVQKIKKAVTKLHPVAGNAKKGQADRKARAKLDGRRADYTAMMASKNTQTAHSRKETGGYRRPGSMQR